MILLFNTLLTADIPWLKYDRGYLSSPSKVDVFKYTLASMACLPFEKAIIYLQIDEAFSDRADEVYEYVRAQFKDIPLSLYTVRNCTQPMWKEALEEVKDLPPGYPIWYMGNHDHPFIDYDLEMVNLCLDAFNAEPASLKSCIYSHWSEFITETLKFPSREEYPGVISYWVDNTHSIQIVSKDLLFSWWYGGNYGDTFLPRSDWWYSNPLKGGQPILKSPDYKCLVPLRELCRHFDGYHHIGVSPQSACPPLDIPQGFFEDDIRLQYSPTKIQGVTTVWPDPTVPFAGDGAGPDLIGVMEDIPLFWRSRISSLKEDLPKSNQQRNLFYSSLMNLVPNLSGLEVPSSWTRYITRTENSI